MDLVKQTMFHDEKIGVAGNCFSAVLASLLHLPIEAVPLFYSPPPQWQKEVNAWLRPFGLAFLQVKDFEIYCRRYEVMGCYSEIGGRTVAHSDILHSCVAKDGIQIFDPHPDGGGLSNPDSCGVFIVLEPWRMAELYCTQVQKEEPRISRLIELEDPTLDMQHPINRLLLLAEYWKNQAKIARKQVRELRKEAEKYDPSVFCQPLE